MTLAETRGALYTSNHMSDSIEHDEDVVVEVSAGVSRTRKLGPIDAWEGEAVRRLKAPPDEKLRPPRAAGNRQRKRAMLTALRKCLGIVTQACEMSGISRPTHYEWLKNDPKYRAEVESLADIALDFGESRLLKQIAEGNHVSTIFFLKTKGRGRGYIERKDVDVTTQGEKITRPPILWTDEAGE